MDPALPFTFGADAAAALLRRPTDDDVDRIAAICTDPAITRFTTVPSPYSRVDAVGFVADVTEAWGADRPSTFVVEVDGRVAAAVGVVTRRPFDGCVTLGYWTAPDVRRRGMTSAAVVRLCRWLLDEVGVQRIQLETAAGNTGSERVAAAAGFRREGVRRSAALLRAVDGLPEQRADMTMWGLLPGELLG